MQCTSTKREQAQIPVIALTGKYCSGKSSIARYFERHGSFHIDVDVIGHEVLQEQAPRIAEVFGSQLYTDFGGIDRRALARIVFSDPEKLGLLEGIVHPPMCARVESLIRGVRVGGERIHQQKYSNKKPVPYIIINAAVLFKMGLDKLSNVIFIIETPAVIRAVRAKQRDGLSFKQFSQRNSSQKELFPHNIRENSDIYSVQNVFLRAAIQRISTIIEGRYGAK